MGTRGTLTFVHNGVEKTTYNHHDSYPDGLGNDVLDFLRAVDLEDLRVKVDRLTAVDSALTPTTEEWEKFKEFANSNVSTGKDWYALLRETQGNPAEILRAGFYEDAKDFPADSLFCEWSYVIDLDAGVLEVYEGFQSAPHDKGRFADRTFDPGYPRMHKYYPVKLVRTYPLSELPENFDSLASELHPDED